MVVLDETAGVRIAQLFFAIAHPVQTCRPATSDGYRRRNPPQAKTETGNAPPVWTGYTCINHRQPPQFISTDSTAPNYHSWISMYKMHTTELNTYELRRTVSTH